MPRRKVINEKRKEIYLCAKCSWICKIIKPYMFDKLSVFGNFMQGMESGNGKAGYWPREAGLRGKHLID